MGQVQLRNRDTHEVILRPTPTADPNDPLNWCVHVCCRDVAAVLRKNRRAPIVLLSCPRLTRGAGLNGSGTTSPA
jgi:hypothetical protein